MRQALAAGINKQELIDGVLLGMGKPATGPFPPQSWAYDPSVTDIPYDPASARAALEHLGWKDTDGDGYRERNGQKLAFTIMTNQGNKMRALSAEIIQAQLKKIGVQVHIRIIEWSAFVHQFIDQRNFEAVLLGWSLSRDPDQYAIWDSHQTGEGQYNFVSYRNEEVDRLLTAGRTTFNQPERQRIYHRIHRILADDLPYLFLYYPEALPVIHKRFRGPEVAAARIGWNFDQWWVPQDDQKYRLKK
jgi:peptide/nickel transport system substrate-binding protein